MSKGIVVLASASVALLAAAAGIVLLLLWQSWEDGRRMEQKNRELQASLEASRIRVENFCEYPMEALCPVDTPGGKHSSVLPPEGVPAPPAPAPDPLPRQASPVQDIPLAGASAVSPVQDGDPRAHHVPGPESRTDKGPQDAPAERPGIEAVPETTPGIIAVRAFPSEDSPAQETPPMPSQAGDAGPQPALHEQEKLSVGLPRSAGQDDAAGVPSPPSEDIILTVPSPADQPARETPAPAPLPEPRPQEQEQEQAPTLRTDTPGSPAGKDPSVSQPAQERPRRTWTTLDQGQDGMLFRIAGAGDALRARGDLLPGKYVVTIEGSWSIMQRQPSTPCVQGMRRSYADGDTVLEFPLRRPPSMCRVKQENERTIAIEIR